ncbi:hypothetical protein GX645_04715 [Candidatus Sumerlaeota bacterium]|nr:hypothetical protein [Candidatus Sumerlaeota bacterium]
MFMRTSLLAALCVVAGYCNAGITGTVFDDANKNGVQDAGEKGISGIIVSDQTVIVKTDKDGKYELPDADNVTIYVTTPAEYMVALDSKTAVPKFYHNIHMKDRGLFKANGAKKDGNDFALIKRENTSKKFKVCVHSDPQIPTEREIYFYRMEVLDFMPGQGYDFMVTLGDISGEALTLFPKIAQAQALAGIPNYGVIGNHDRNYDATNMEESSASYKETYGPDYYSFNRGDVHFVALNTVFFNNKKAWYEDGMDKKQLEWLKADLQEVPKDKTVVLMMHIPIAPEYPRNSSGFHGKQELFDMLADREASILAIGGHWHTNNSITYSEKDGFKGKHSFSMVIVPTVCGSWWSGPLDYRGIPSSDQSDGTPNGYTVWSFDGTKYQCDYKPAAINDEFQARIYTPEMRIEDMASTTVLVNFFMAPSTAKVEMSVDGGDWETMKHVEMVDPYALALFSGPYSTGPSWMGTKGKSLHIWQGTLPEKMKPGLHQVKVKTRLLDGRECIQSRSYNK